MHDPVIPDLTDKEVDAFITAIKPGNRLAAAVLAEACTEFPELALLEWQVTNASATTSLLQLGRMHTESGENGVTLVVVPSPDALNLVNRLHAGGWKRDGEYENEHAWSLTATLERDGAVLQVHGLTRIPPENGRNAIPYFAPPPPELPARMSAAFKAQYAEWDRTCRESKW